MKRALQALLIAPGLTERTAIENGGRQVTIREGERDYTLGPVMLCCHIEPWAVMADITQVYSRPLNEVIRTDILDDGYKDYRDALEQLQHFYPNLTLSSPVTVVRWENVKGKLTESNIRTLTDGTKIRNVGSIYFEV